MGEHLLFFATKPLTRLMTSSLDITSNSPSDPTTKKSCAHAKRASSHSASEAIIPHRSAHHRGRVGTAHARRAFQVVRAGDSESDKDTRGVADARTCGPPRRLRVLMSGSALMILSGSFPRMPPTHLVMASCKSRPEPAVGMRTCTRRQGKDEFILARHTQRSRPQQ